MLVGSDLGSYQLVAELGEGGMGTVYLGEHTLIGRRAAIKVLRPELTRNPRSIDRFFAEAHALSSVSDPGIVQLFDVGVTPDNVVYIVMELLEGERLDHRIERVGALAPIEALRITRQLAVSLHSAHGVGIIHRDLKPENVFVVRDPEIASGERTKIIDFGIAKLLSGPVQVRTKTGIVIGTPMYMPPEQCRAERDNIDHRADVYALGAVLFHLLTGRPPFDLEGTKELVYSHLYETPPQPSSIALESLPAGFDELVSRCMAKLPADRYPSMLDVVNACDALIDAASPRALSATPVPKLHTVLLDRRKRGRWLVAAAAAAVAGVALVLATAVAGRSPDPDPVPAVPAPPELPASPGPQAIQTPDAASAPVAVEPPPPVAAATVPSAPITQPPRSKSKRPPPHAPPAKARRDMYDDRN